MSNRNLVPRNKKIINKKLIYEETKNLVWQGKFSPNIDKVPVLDTNPKRKIPNSAITSHQIKLPNPTQLVILNLTNSALSMPKNLTQNSKPKPRILNQNSGIQHHISPILTQKLANFKP